MGRNPVRAQEMRIQAIRNSTFGKTMRKPIIDCINAKSEKCDAKMDQIEAQHNERVSSFTTVPITGMTDYFRLVVGRANDQ